MIRNLRHLTVFYNLRSWAQYSQDFPLIPSPNGAQYLFFGSSAYRVGAFPYFKGVYL
jgi:hypothetical protein